MKDRLIKAWRKVGFWLVKLGTKMQGDRTVHQMARFAANQQAQPSNDLADEIMAVISRESTLMASLVERDVRRIAGRVPTYKYEPSAEELAAAEHVRQVCAEGNGESVLPSKGGYVPCAQAHEPGRICIQPKGHA